MCLVEKEIFCLYPIYPHFSAAVQITRTLIPYGIYYFFSELVQFRRPITLFMLYISF